MTSKSSLTCLVHRDFHSEYGRFIPLIIVATIPTGIIGVLYDLYLGDTYQTFLIMGITFLIGATLLFSSNSAKKTKPKSATAKHLSWVQLRAQPVFQGSPEAAQPSPAGLLQGIKREMVFKFSFLLSIPAVIGDLAVEAYHERGSFSQGVGVTPLDLAIGLVFTVIAGYLSIVLVKKLVLTKRFHYFAIYTFALGIALIILGLLGI